MKDFTMAIILAVIVFACGFVVRSINWNGRVVDRIMNQPSLLVSLPKIVKPEMAVTSKNVNKMIEDFNKPIVGTLDAPKEFEGVERSAWYAGYEARELEEKKERINTYPTATKIVSVEKQYDIFCSLPYYEPMQSGLSYEMINKGVNTDFQYLADKMNELAERIRKLEEKK